MCIRDSAVSTRSRYAFCECSHAFELGVLKTVVRLARAANPQTTVEATLRLRTSLSVARDHTATTKPITKLANTRKKNVRSRQHWTSMVRPAISKIQIA